MELTCRHHGAEQYDWFDGTPEGRRVPVRYFSETFSHEVEILSVSLEVKGDLIEVPYYSAVAGQYWVSAGETQDEDWSVLYTRQTNPILQLLEVVEEDYSSSGPNSLCNLSCGVDLWVQHPEWCSSLFFETETCSYEEETALDQLLSSQLMEIGYSSEEIQRSVNGYRA